MKHSRPAWFAVLGFVFLLGFCSRLAAEETALSVSRDTGTPGLKGVVYRFFDDKTGTCTGRLRIGSVGLEYRRKGFLRVAWRPLVVLDQVELDLGADLVWSAQGAQIGRELQALGGREELLLRDVRLHLAGSPGREIAAATARLLPGGTLELLDATVTAAGDPPGAGPAGTFHLVLAGPEAGRLTRVAAVAGLPDRKNFSSANTFSPPNP